MIAEFPSIAKNLAINEVTGYVIESYPNWLIHSHTYRLLHQSPHILFILINEKQRVTNQNEIHCYMVYKIVGIASTITIRNDSSY